MTCHWSGKSSSRGLFHSKCFQVVAEVLVACGTTLNDNYRESRVIKDASELEGALVSFAFSDWIPGLFAINRSSGCQGGWIQWRSRVIRDSRSARVLQKRFSLHFLVEALQFGELTVSFLVLLVQIGVLFLFSLLVAFRSWKRYNSIQISSRD